MLRNFNEELCYEYLLGSSAFSGEEDLIDLVVQDRDIIEFDSVIEPRENLALNITS